jgi:hypothetical protein
MDIVMDKAGDVCISLFSASDSFHCYIFKCSASDNAQAVIRCDCPLSVASLLNTIIYTTGNCYRVVAYKASHALWSSSDLL